MPAWTYRVLVPVPRGWVDFRPGVARELDTTRQVLSGCQARQNETCIKATGVRESTGATHRLSLCGEVAELMRQCGVKITSGFSQEEPTFVGKASDFPVELRAADFGAAFLEVTHATGTRAFSVLLDRPLFRDDADCNLGLDKPKCETSVCRSRTGLRIRHWAWIAEKICYADMPRWDSQQKILTCADAPFLEVRSAKNPTQPVTSGKMDSGCIGYGWLAFPSIPPEARSGETLTITVTHETGDLWRTISTTTQYTME